MNDCMSLVPMKTGPISGHGHTVTVCASQRLLGTPHARTLNSLMHSLLICTQSLHIHFSAFAFTLSVASVPPPSGGVGSWWPGGGCQNQPASRQTCRANPSSPYSVALKRPAAALGLRTRLRPGVSTLDAPIQPPWPIGSRWVPTLGLAQHSCLALSCVSSRGTCHSLCQC
jgi:hypothetical protein